MSDTTLYTIRDVARELDIPESTVRYYRDSFSAHIPSVGTGRRARYPQEAVDVLRTIAEGYAAGMSRDAIEQRLGGRALASHPLPEALPSTLIAAHSLDPLNEDHNAPGSTLAQMASEIVRLGDAIERQQIMLGSIADRLDSLSARALPPGLAPDGTSIGGAPRVPGVPDTPVRGAQGTGSLTGDLRALREELEAERALVERLRRAKLEFEQRATEAEALLRAQAVSERSGGLFGWLFRRPRAEGGSETADSIDDNTSGE